MRELFGVPVGVLAVVLGSLVIVTAAAVAVLALRNEVFFKLGVRNLNRRRGRTAIIVGGLMLGTMIIGSALGFGDIMAHTVRTSVIASLGQTDEIVTARTTEEPAMVTLGQGTGARYLTAREAAAVVDAARELANVDAVTPAISESVAVQNPTSRRTEPQVTLFAADPAAMTGMGEITSDSDGTVSLGDLAGRDVYLNSEAAEDLDAETGDRLLVSAGGRQTALTVRAVVSYDGTGTNGSAMLMPLDLAQDILGVGDKVQQVRVSNDGGELSGTADTGAVMAALEPSMTPLGLVVEPVKTDGLERADEEGATYLSLFSTFGTFTIAAGILLIFLVFVLLATERRGEMGTARAIGTQRRHLVQMFVFEGAAYDLLAAFAGAVLGLLLAVGMVRVIAGAVSASGIATIRYDLRWSSLVLAFSIGALLTLAVVLIAAWRVSRLNIVAAVRNLPQPPKRRRRRSRWLFVTGCELGGALLIAVAYQTGSVVALLVGGTLAIIGVVPLIRLLGASERLAHTIGGVGVVVWNLLPFRVYEGLVPGLRMGFSVYILAGLVLVAGATWVIVRNTPALLAALMWVFGHSRRAAPVVKASVAQPMRSLFRTGATLGLFTLVVFTLVSGASISNSFMTALDDEETFGGGYDVTAQTSPLSPIHDMDASLREATTLERGDITSHAGQSYVPVEAKQADQVEYAGYILRGLDESFLQTTTYSFATRAEGYDSDREVWRALATRPGLAVVDAYSVPRRASWGTAVVSDFRLDRIYLEDQGFEPVPIRVREAQSGALLRLEVIGVLSDSVPYAMLGISTSQQTLAPLGELAAPTVWYFRVGDGVDPEAAVARLEAAFLEHGMTATAQREALREAVGASLTFQYLVLGFLGLGLVIGVAALGVISARSVVERRQQIGVLRAIGFQARMVQASFLIESLFITTIGVVAGAALGLVIAFNVVDDTADQPGWQALQLQPPWLALIGILGAVVLSSLVATWLPSVRASRIYPATALRYE
jgi:putative ABC transport system permease protein